MEILLILGLLGAALGLLVLTWRRRESSRARRGQLRDDTLRVGHEAAATPEQAAKRAGDRSSWMIPSGF